MEETTLTGCSVESSELPLCIQKDDIRFVYPISKKWPADRCCHRVKSWQVDETYVKIRGRWTYLYRAVDRVDKTVDVRRSAKRDVSAARALFKKAIKS